MPAAEGHGQHSVVVVGVHEDGSPLLLERQLGEPSRAVRGTHRSVGRAGQARVPPAVASAEIVTQSAMR